MSIIDLHSLGKELWRQYAEAQPQLVVEVSNAGRLLTMIPAGSEVVAADPTLKTTTRAAPPGKTFELYVSVESASEAAASQRVIPPTQTGTSLTLDEDRREQMWTVSGPADDRVVVRLQLGKDMTADDARRLLKTIERWVSP